MPINLPDQQSVGLGGSSIAPRDTFSMPGMDQGAQRNAEALSRSLEGFGNTLMGAGAEDRQRKNSADAQLRQLHATQLADAINGGEAVDVAMGRIAPNLSYLNRVAAQQAAGSLMGAQLADQALLDFPDGLTDQPEKLKEWYSLQRSGIASRYKDNPFVQAGVLETLNQRFTAHEANMYAKANADSHANQSAAFSSSVKNIIDTTVPPKTTPDAIRTGTVPPPAPNYGYQINTGAAPNRAAANALVSTANSLGINPHLLAILVSYETGGTFSPSIRGGKNNAHIGAIQFGAWEQKKYGIRPGMSFEEQMPIVGRYLKDRGAQPGDDLLTLYKIVNGGNRNVSANASDGNGTIAEHVKKMQKEHAANAIKFLTGSTDERLITASGRPVDTPPPKDQFTLFDEEEPDDILDPDVMALRTNLLAADQEADQAATPQLTRRERKKIMLGEVIRKASTLRDAKWLYAIPETMLDPEEREQIKQVREQIVQLKIRDYEFNRRIAKDQEEDQRDRNIDSVLSDLADPQKALSIDPLTDPRIVINGKRDPKMIQMIVQAQSMPRVPSIVSTNKRAEIETALEAYGQSGDVSGLTRVLGITKGGDIEKKVREALLTLEGINGPDKDYISQNINPIITRSAIVNEQVVQNAYTVGGSVKNFIGGAYGKLVPPTLDAEMYNMFSNNFNDSVKAWYSANPGKTMTTDVKRQLALDANKLVDEEFEKRYRRITGAKDNPQDNTNTNEPGWSIRVKP